MAGFFIQERRSTAMCSTNCYRYCYLLIKAESRYWKIVNWVEEVSL
jgi:hypothetical protein